MNKPTRCYCKQLGKIDKLDKCPCCEFCGNKASEIHKLDQWVYSVCYQCHSMFAGLSYKKQRELADPLRRINPYRESKRKRF